MKKDISMNEWEQNLLTHDPTDDWRQMGLNETVKEIFKDPNSRYLGCPIIEKMPQSFQIYTFTLPPKNWCRYASSREGIILGAHFGANVLSNLMAGVQRIVEIEQQFFIMNLNDRPEIVSIFTDKNQAKPLPDKQNNCWKCLIDITNRSSPYHNHYCPSSGQCFDSLSPDCDTMQLNHASFCKWDQLSKSDACDSIEEIYKYSPTAPTFTVSLLPRTGCSITFEVLKIWNVDSLLVMPTNLNIKVYQGPDTNGYGLFERSDTNLEPSHQIPSNQITKLDVQCNATIELYLVNFDDLEEGEVSIELLNHLKVIKKDYDYIN